MREVGSLSVSDLRQMAVSKFAARLRGQANKHKRPFQEHTITLYSDAGRTLDRWMTAQKIDEDFTARGSGRSILSARS